MSQKTMTDQLTAYIEKLITDKRSKSFITYSRRYIIDFLKYTEDKTLTKTLVKEWALSLNEKTNTPHEMRNIVYSVNGFLAFLNCSEFKLGKEKDFSFDDNGKLYLLLKPSDDLTGKRFNRLVVIKGVLDENGKRKWLCKCDCGNEITVSAGILNLGRKKSCGCLLTERTPDLVGKRFGKLTVIKRSEEKDIEGVLWECLCDCGNKCLKPTGKLTKGTTKSCGCLRKSSVVAGQKYGRLTAIEPLERRSKSRGVYWRCKCDCGNEIEVTSGSLVSGHTASCGCWLMDVGLKKLHSSLDFVDSTCVQYLENIGNHKANTSPDTGVRGVSVTRNGRYMAQIGFRKKLYYLGIYANLDDAVRIRKAAEMLVDECLEDYKNGIPFPDKLPVEKLYK